MSRWDHITADGRGVVAIVGDSNSGMSRGGHLTADGRDVVVAVSDTAVVT